MLYSPGIAPPPEPSGSVLCVTFRLTPLATTWTHACQMAFLAADETLRIPETASARFVLPPATMALRSSR